MFLKWVVLANVMIVTCLACNIFAYGMEDVPCSNISYPCYVAQTAAQGNGTMCLALSKICDGRRDCPIGDDEFYCTELPRVDNCHNKFVCPEDASCVDYDAICDGRKNCTNGGDEMGCNLTCPSSDCQCGGFNVRCKGMGWNQTLSAAVPQHIALLYLVNLTLSMLNETANDGIGIHDFVDLQNMTRLKMIALSRNGINQLDKGAFKKQLSLKYLDLSTNKITELPSSTFEGLGMLRDLYLHKNRISIIAADALKGLESLEVIFLQENNIRRLHQGTFLGLHSLKTLGLYQNNISEITTDVFNGLSNLQYLDIGDNKISKIQLGSFRHLENLQSLHIYLNKLRTLEGEMFHGLVSLAYLDLTDNFITQIEHGAFSNLSLLNELMIFPTDIRSLESDVFYGLDNLQILSADDHRFCCFFGNLKSCETPPSPFATCDGLLRRLSLRICIWILGILAIIGNVCVIMWRWKDRKHPEVNVVQILLIANLAVSDLLMGLYMLLIGGADAFYGHHYYLHGEIWRKHAVCKLAGILSVLSSEASVFLVTVISLDRFLCVVFPFGRLRLRKKSAVRVIIIIWVLAAILSVIPTILSDYVENFYGLSDVCIGLPLVTTAKNFTMSIDETNDSGFVYYAEESDEGPMWYFSILLFIVLNLICFLIIVFCYVAIFISVQKSSRKSYTRPRETNEEVKMAVKMAFIVWTDLCCWIPIIIMGILSQSGLFEIPVEMYAWTVIFILPINSCLNPYLYTITSKISTRKRNARRKRNESRDHGEMLKLKTTVNSFVSNNTIDL